MTYIYTYHGHRFDYAAPQPAMIDPRDIAHALSHLARFNGHTHRHYSVAEHSINVARLVGPSAARLALLHDAAEAYTGDIVTPLKRLIPGFREIEERITAVINERFGLNPTPEQLREVHAADRYALHAEAWEFTPSGRLWARPSPGMAFGSGEDVAAEWLRRLEDAS
jgi:hypothetical protein